MRDLVSIVESHRAGPQDRRPPSLLWRERPSSFPGLAGTRLAPAWASWTPATEPCCSTNAKARCRGSTWRSLHDPKSTGLMRPVAVTAVASQKTAAARPTARLPRCTRCHSVASPSLAEYRHMGETRMRWGSSTLRSRSDSNKWAINNWGNIVTRDCWVLLPVVFFLEKVQSCAMVQPPPKFKEFKDEWGTTAREGYEDRGAFRQRRVPGKEPGSSVLRKLGGLT